MPTNGDNSSWYTESAPVSVESRFCQETDTSVSEKQRLNELVEEIAILRDLVAKLVKQQERILSLYHKKDQLQSCIETQEGSDLTKNKQDKNLCQNDIKKQKHGEEKEDVAEEQAMVAQPPNMPPPIEIKIKPKQIYYSGGNQKSLQNWIEQFEIYKTVSDLDEANLVKHALFLTEGRARTLLLKLKDPPETFEELGKLLLKKFDPDAQERITERLMRKKQSPEECCLQFLKNYDELAERAGFGEKIKIHLAMSSLTDKNRQGIGTYLPKGHYTYEELLEAARNFDCIKNSLSAYSEKRNPSENENNMEKDTNQTLNLLESGQKDIEDDVVP